MTAQRIWDIACSFLTETAESNIDLAIYAPKWINMCVAEAFQYENFIRKFNDEAALVAIPDITALTDNVPYCDEICRVALPYGVAHYLYQDDDNDYRAQDYRARFVAALNESQKTGFEVGNA